MKNLLVYLNPTKTFDYESARYVEIQIDNSLLYFKPEDIILVTNFPYEYRGIKSLEVGDEMICTFDTKACKINVIIYLLEKGLLPGVTWYHDLEAFQNNSFDVALEKDLGLTDYGWTPKWNTGSFFFTPKALDVFQMLKDELYKRQANEEPVLWILYKNNVNNIRDRCEKLNITYNLGKRHVETNFDNADKPIKVVHFHPYRRPDRFERFKPLLSENLLKIFHEKSPHLRKPWRI